MKALLILLFCFGPLLAADMREQRLEELRLQFPEHVSGIVTEKSEAHVQVCYKKYRNLVFALRLEALPEQIVSLERHVSADIHQSEYLLRNSAVELSEPERIGVRQNITWLQQRVTPYLKRLSQFQRAK